MNDIGKIAMQFEYEVNGESNMDAALVFDVPYTEEQANLIDELTDKLIDQYDNPSKLTLRDWASVYSNSGISVKSIIDTDMTMCGIGVTPIGTYKDISPAIKEEQHDN